MRNFKGIIAVTMAVLMGFAPVTVLGSQRFVDVPQTHWAHDAIINMSDSGFMVGNTAGQFMPDAPLDKFETARILSQVAGFRHVNLTPAEEALINTAYDNHSQLLTQMSQTFSRWSNAANREIAFLLEMGILTPSDLNNFILVSGGQEQLRALSRQEAAVFLVRAFGLSEQAAEGTFSQLFTDDASINAAARHYVYFLRANGVISGDPQGNFLPNAPVNRASLAVMLDRAMSLAASYAPTQIEVISGTITFVYPSIGALQIQENGSSVIYRTSANVTINVDGNPSTFGNLTPGMEISATLEGGQIIALLASTTATAPELPPTQYDPAPPPVPPARPRVITPLHGHVAEVDGGYIIVELRFLTPTGSVATELMAFERASDLTVTKANQSFPFTSIIPGDIVSMTVGAGLVFEIEVTQRERAFFGTLLERVSHPSADTMTYIIEDSDGGRHSLIVTEETTLEREGQGHVNRNQIRIGDTLELNASGPYLVSAFAFGHRSTVDGIVEVIILRQDLSEISVTTAGTTTTYFVTGTLENINSLRVGDRVRLRLDSRELEGFTILY